MKGDRKLTSINMKVSNRLHNQRTTLVLQALQNWELCSTKDHYKITELHTYTQKICKQQQRHARASMALHLLSQTVHTVSSAHAFPCQTQAQTVWADKLPTRSDLSDLPFMGERRCFNHLPPLSLTASSGSERGRVDLAPGKRGSLFLRPTPTFRPLA
jgi:hypothetical protein